MLAVTHPFTRRLAKPLAFALTLAALFFLLQVAPHAHAKGQDEAACRLCQVAHLGVTPAVSALSFSVPFVEFGSVTILAAAAGSEPSSSLSSSRAPPAFFAL
jgi:hypothetical protein